MTKQKNYGRFIVFEGIDGSGKTTQAKLFADKINAKLTREPYEDEEIRNILRSENNPYSNAEKMAELFIQDRKKHLQEFIMPNILNGYNVVSDRYILSTLAYQSAQGVDIKELYEMHEDMGIIPADLTFFVDLSVDTAMKRTDKLEKKFERENTFQELLSEKYKEAINLLLSEGHDIVFVDGHKDINSLAECVSCLYESNFYFNL